MAKLENVLKVKVKSFKNGFALLGFTHNQDVTVPKRYLPKGLKEGDILEVEFLTKEQAGKRRRNLAQAILDEILNL